MPYSLQDVISPITITNYGRGAHDAVIEHIMTMKLIKDQADIERNQSGTNFTWEVEGGRHAAFTTADDQDVTSQYQPKKRFVQPVLNWGQITAFCRFGKGQLRQNDGDQALVSFRDKEIPAMFRDIYDSDTTAAPGANGGIVYQFWNSNGSTYAGAGLPIYGVASFLNTSNATATSANQQFASWTGASTYAGLSLVSGALSSLIDGAEADAWTPTAINITASGTAWNVITGAGTFTGGIGSVKQIMDAGILAVDRFSSQDKKLRPSCIVGNRKFFGDLQNAIVQNQNYYITPADGSAMSKSLGFGTNRRTLIWDGDIEIYWDARIPDVTTAASGCKSQAFITNFRQVNLKIMRVLPSISADKNPMKVAGDDSGEAPSDKDWFEVESNYNQDRRSVTISATFNGQFGFMPRYWGWFYPFS